VGNIFEIPVHPVKQSAVIVAFHDDMTALSGYTEKIAAIAGGCDTQR
jgi:hypothetical protein